MAKEKKTFEFAPLPGLPTVLLAEPMPEPVASSIPVTTSTEGVTKVTFDCPNEVLEQMKDFGYWEGLTQKDIILEALSIFFADKDIRTRPDKVKARPKVGRKPKR